MFCSRCGTSLADGSQFCVECGHTVEGGFSAVPAPAAETVCPKCNKNVFPGAGFCSNCGTTAPVPPAVAIPDGGAAATAARLAYEPAYGLHRRAYSRGRLLIFLLVIIALGAFGWIAATNASVAQHMKTYLTTAHAETITEDSVAIKPHGFSSYRVTVPEGAIDVALSGQFEATGRTESDIQVYVLTESEFVIWQSGYATSPFYDSGKVSQAAIQASLPSRAGTYYLVLSNRPSKMEKTVRITAGLHYDTWVPDPLMSLKEKIVGWFE